jgi:hypothetical protein
MTNWEGELNYVALANCQQAGEKLEKDLKNSLGICAKLHKATIILTIKCHLPQIGELGQPKLEEQVQEELEEDMHAREMVVKTPLRVTSALMDEHLVKPTRAQSMIQDFLANLKRDMKTLSQNSTTHEVTLESLLYHRIISISGYHEVWEPILETRIKGNLNINSDL